MKRKDKNVQSADVKMLIYYLYMRTLNLDRIYISILSLLNCCHTKQKFAIGVVKNNFSWSVSLKLWLTKSFQNVVVMWTIKEILLDSEINKVQIIKLSL